ncbi:hypothetical protein LOAG_09462 [Loa loa]|uniref:Uncharacterized protein n=1 Tax=Loa loa TaxID=7209 RepID=A0A1I7VVE4_LOALO|nr:hypothetical protein LOAG_09462 [Loa loa]EFO19033.1 hypothetical protein LOAG_09462 [Loa loa]
MTAAVSAVQCEPDLGGILENILVFGISWCGIHAINGKYLPNTEFIFNFGNWQLVKAGNDLVLVISRCGSRAGVFGV